MSSSFVVPAPYLQLVREGRYSHVAALATACPLGDYDTQSLRELGVRDAAEFGSLAVINVGDDQVAEVHSSLAAPGG
jgi:hypothetical protein